MYEISKEEWTLFSAIQLAGRSCISLFIYWSFGVLAFKNMIPFKESSFAVLLKHLLYFFGVWNSSWFGLAFEIYSKLVATCILILRRIYFYLLIYLNIIHRRECKWLLVCLFKGKHFGKKIKFFYFLSHD